MPDIGTIPEGRGVLIGRTWNVVLYLGLQPDARRECAAQRQAHGAVIHSVSLLFLVVVVLCLLLLPRRARSPMLKPSLLLLSLASFAATWTHVLAVTVYGQEGVTAPSGVSSTAGASATANTDWVNNYAAYNNKILTAPNLPDPVPSNAFTIQLLNNAANVNALSVPQSGNFLGFSVEVSVVTQVSEYIYPLSYVQTTRSHDRISRIVGKNAYAQSLSVLAWVYG